MRVLSGILKTFFLGLLFISVSTLSWAQKEEVSVSANIDATEIGVGTAVGFKISVKGSQNVRPIELPVVDGLDIKYLGPTRNMSFINGKSTTSVTFNYSLFAVKAGSFTIPSFEFPVDGKVYTIKPIALNVSDAPAALKSAQKQDNPGVPMGLEDRVFLELRTAKDEVFINEKVPVKVFLYVAGVEINSNQTPKIQGVGFSKAEFKDLRQYKQTINGIRYHVAEYSTEIYPTRIGEIALGPASLECMVIVKSKANGRGQNLFNDDFFDSFFTRREKAPLTVTSKGVKLKVKDLPKEGRPENAVDVVGNFSFEVSVGPDEVYVGDPITVRMAIQGDGNLKAIEFPKFPDNENFKLYDPIISDSGNTKELEQVLIPRSENVVEVPELVFSYFNVNLGKYVTVKKGPFPIKVNPSPTGDSYQMVAANTRPFFNKKPEVFGQDIVFIKKSPGSFKAMGKNRHQTFFYKFLLFLTIVGIAFGTFVLNRFRRLETDSAYAKKMKAPKEAKQGLEQAKAYIAAGKKELVYDGLFKTLQHYLRHKFQLPAGDVNAKAVQSFLKGSVKDKQVIEDLDNIFKKCDMMRYASIDSSTRELEGLHKKSENIIDYLERYYR